MLTNTNTDIKMIKSFKKTIALITAVVFFGNFAMVSSLSAQEYRYPDDHVGYYDYRTSPFVTPKVALTAVVIAAIIIVALNDNDHSH